MFDKMVLCYQFYHIFPVYWLCDTHTHAHYMCVFIYLRFDFISKAYKTVFQVVCTLSTGTACAVTLKMNNAHVLLVAIEYGSIFPIKYTKFQVAQMTCYD